MDTPANAATLRDDNHEAAENPDAETSESSDVEVDLGEGSDSNKEDGSSSSEDDDEDEEESGDEEEDEESEKEAGAEGKDNGPSSSDSDDSSDSEADDVWGDASSKKENVISTDEATESGVLFKFNEALSCMTEGNTERAIRLFKRILKNPLVSVYHTVDFDWDREHDDERLPKMARLFVGIHKNLAALVDEEATEHYLQILSQAPRNPQIWFELGSKMVEIGDLEFARFAFEKNQDARGMEALAGVLYLSGNYHGFTGQESQFGVSACLHKCKEMLEIDPKQKKALFLKDKIAAVNKHFSDCCDEIFGESRHYDANRQANALYNKQANARLAALQQRLSNLNEKSRDEWKMEEVYPVIELKMHEHYTLTDVATLFCDLFDRVEAYSRLRQKFSFANWPDPKIRRDATATVDYLLDCVETVDTIMDQIDSISQTTRKKSADTLKLSRKQLERLAYRRSARNTDRETGDTEESSQESEDDSEDSDNTFASYLGLYPSPSIIPLQTVNGSSSRPSKTPSPPPGLDHCFNEDEMLDELRELILEGNRPLMIRECFEILLLLLVEYCPSQGCIPQGSLDVWTQCYRRMNRMSSLLVEQKWIPVHVLFHELDEPEARGYCLVQSHHEGWPNAELAKRFAWTHAHKSRDDINIAFLSALQDLMDPDEYIYTGTGRFCVIDVISRLVRLQRMDRVNSLNTLRLANRHEELVQIITNDVVFASLDDEDVVDTCHMWMDSLMRLGRWTEMGELLLRILDWHLNNDSFLEDDVKKLLLDVEETPWEEMGKELLSAVGHELLKFTENDDMLKWWPLWRTVYRIVQAIEGPLSLEMVARTIAAAEGDDGGDDLPTLALGVLVRAHEKIGGRQCCAQEQGSFLSFFLRELWSVICIPGVVPLLREEKNEWMWNNVNDEIAQLLNCVFGKYSKKKRNVDEHGSPPTLTTEFLEEIEDSVIGLALPNPLPVYDDKERLGHDIIDLVNARFPHLLEVNGVESKRMEEFDQWLKTQLNSSEWPRSDDVSQLLASVYYSFALHNYRVSKHDESARFATLFLSSSLATRSNPVTYSAWAILAHTTLAHMFQLPDDQIMVQHRWHMRPFRISVECNNEVPIVQFEFGHTLYQLASRMGRYLERLPEDNVLHRRGSLTVKELRGEAMHTLQQALSLSSQENVDFQWIIYFLLAKLHIKEDPESEECIIKALDCFYEAACSLELNMCGYPAKIAAKHQKNVEPVELHYQAHATVWKVIERMPCPSRSLLVGCLSYLRALQSHGVCTKGATSLFSVQPEMLQLVLELTDKCSSVCDEENVVPTIVDDLVSRADLMDELWKLCQKGFEVCIDRFPHHKAYYRLAEMALSRGDVATCANHVFKGIFRKKKKEEGNYFEGMIEITCGDITRSASFTFHVARSAEMAVSVARIQYDHQALASILCTLLGFKHVEDTDWISPRDQVPLMWTTWRAFKWCVSNETKRGHTAKSDLFRIYSTFEKFFSSSSGLFAARFRLELSKLIEKLYGDVAAFSSQMTEGVEVKKRQIRKRKIAVEDLAVHNDDVYSQFVPPEKVPAVVEVPNVPVKGSGADLTDLMRAQYMQLLLQQYGANLPATQSTTTTPLSTASSSTPAVTQPQRTTSSLSTTESLLNSIRDSHKSPQKSTTTTPTAASSSTSTVTQPQRPKLPAPTESLLNIIRASQGMGALGRVGYLPKKGNAGKPPSTATPPQRSTESLLTSIQTTQAVGDMIKASQLKQAHSSPSTAGTPTTNVTQPQRTAESFLNSVRAAHAAAGVNRVGQALQGKPSAAGSVSASASPSAPSVTQAQLTTEALLNSIRASQAAAGMGRAGQGVQAQGRPQQSVQGAQPRQQGRPQPALAPAQIRRPQPKKSPGMTAFSSWLQGMTNTASAQSSGLPGTPRSSTNQSIPRKTADASRTAVRPTLAVNTVGSPVVRNQNQPSTTSTVEDDDVMIID